MNFKFSLETGADRFLTKMTEIGRIVAAAGTAHSIYFLIFIPGDFNGVISGLAAFAIMI